MMMTKMITTLTTTILINFNIMIITRAKPMFAIK